MCNKHDVNDIEMESVRSKQCSTVDDNSSVETNDFIDSKHLQIEVKNNEEKTQRLPSGILVFVTNEIAKGESEIYKMIQSDELNDSRARRRFLLSKSNIEKPCVRFSNISIREFPYEIGDNPSSSSCPSLSIQWKHRYEHTIPVDEYESAIPVRRKGREMLIPTDIRMNLLRKEGYSLKQIRIESRTVNIARRQRRRTIGQLEMTNIHEKSEKVTRATLNILTFGSRKRRENKYLTQACAFVQ